MFIIIFKLFTIKDSEKDYKKRLQTEIKKVRKQLEYTMDACHAFNIGRKIP